MLSDEVIDKVVERLANRMEQANLYVLKEIARSIKEIGTINPTKLQQLIQTLKYGGDFDKIIKELEKQTKLNAKEIEQIFEEVAKSDYKFAKQYYEYRNQVYVPYEKNIELQNQVKALSRIAQEDYLNLTKTTTLGFGIPDKDGNIEIKGIKEAYYDLVDEAVVSIAQGKETFDSAMYRQLKSLGESGLRVVYPTTYIDKNGEEKHYTRRLDSAVRMNMNTALSNLHSEMQTRIGEEIGADGVEISVHEFPAEDHQDAQGKQFSKKEFEKLQTTGIATTYDKKHIDMHISKSFRPIREYNCRHYEFAIVLGVDKAQYTNKELNKIKERNSKGFEYEGKHYSMYEGTQLQRQIETEIRRQKDNQIMAKEADNQQLALESQKKIKVLSQKYKELNDISGLQAKANRMKVEGYKRITNSEIKPFYEDVTEEWINNAKPGDGKVINRSFYVDKAGNKYKVDGKNVVLDPSDDEVDFANFIHKELGGNIYLNPKVMNPEGIETSDYLWKNEYWDKKSIGKGATSMTRAVDNAIKNHKGQTDYIFLDITNSKIPEDVLLEQSRAVFADSGRTWVKGIMIVNNNKIVKIYIQKKRLTPAPTGKD